MNAIVYKCDFITVGVDFYSLYKWPEIDRNQTFVDGNIKYFRIGLRSYIKKDKDTDEEYLKNICQINISYVKKEEKKLYLYKTNILELYNYLIKYHDKEETLKYVKRLCKNFYVPKYNKKYKTIIEDYTEKEYIINNKNEILEYIFDKKYVLPKNIKIIEYKNTIFCPESRNGNNKQINTYIKIKYNNKSYSNYFARPFYSFYKNKEFLIFYYNFYLIIDNINNFIYSVFVIIFEEFLWLIYKFFKNTINTFS